MWRSLVERCALGLILALPPLARGAGAEPEESAAAKGLGYDPTPDFIAFDPQYRRRKSAARATYKELQRILNEAEKTGRKTQCSKQLLDEAKWLLHYTADFARLDRRLSELRAMLAKPEDPHEIGQDASDGSFGCCSEEWFFKLVRTDDEVVVRELTLRPPKKPMPFLERINSPEKLTSHLEGMLVSDVRRTGVDRRYELSLTVSILTRFLMWEIPSSHEFHPGLRKALTDFEDARWQDPRTGYWGAWYRGAGGEIEKTADLSTTFHIIHYREGDVRRWPEIVRTTLAMKDQEYPHGWLEDGVMSNHHNYDVVAILRRGWKHMSDDQKAATRPEIRKMLRFCLDETLNEDGSFKLRADETTYAGAQLFGVSLLDELGYLDRQKRFWTDEAFAEAAAVRARIQTNLASRGWADAEIAQARLIIGLSALTR